MIILIVWSKPAVYGNVYLTNSHRKLSIYSTLKLPNEGIKYAYIYNTAKTLKGKLIAC